MKRRVSAVWLAAALCLALAGCGGSGGGGDRGGETAAIASEAQAPAPEEWDSAVNYQSMDTTVNASDAGNGGTSDAPQERPAKFIYTAHLEMETTDFDSADQGLDRLTEECGGYFESSSVNNWGGGYRYADYTVRVPAERYESFLGQAGELCHVLSRQRYRENISESYYDTAGRLETQQIKLDRLQELLSKAEAMEDIIALESAISETEQKIDEFSGTLRHYDAQVEYSTVNISLREVYKLSNVEEPASGFASRIGSAFSSGWQNFVDGMADFAVALAYSWMWVLLLAAAVTVAVRTLRKRRKQRKAFAEKPSEDKTE